MTPTMMVVIGVGVAVLVIALIFVLRPQPQPIPMIRTPQSDEQAEAWLAGLERVSMRKAAGTISNRYADYKAGQITDAFVGGVQPPKS